MIVTAAVSNSLCYVMKILFWHKTKKGRFHITFLWTLPSLQEGQAYKVKCAHCLSGSTVFLNRGHWKKWNTSLNIENGRGRYFWQADFQLEQWWQKVKHKGRLNHIWFTGKQPSSGHTSKSSLSLDHTSEVCRMSSYPRLIQIKIPITGIPHIFETTRSGTLSH